MKNPGMKIRYKLRTCTIMMSPLTKKEHFMWREMEEYIC